MENRTPNVGMRKHLRKEVNYGCPICRSPFLAYHHFDPPWEPNHIHNIEGMIALCPLHHEQADVGTWTNEEFRNMKRANYNSINGQVHWSLRKSVIVAGRNLFLGSNIAFKMLGQEIFKLKEIRQNTVVLNALLFNEKKQPVLQIVDNDIILAPDLVKDFNCTASANRIRVDVRDNNSFLEITYSRKTLDNIISLLDEELRENENVISLIKKKEIDNQISLVEIKFNIYTEEFDFKCRVPDMVFDFRKSGLDSAKFSGRFFGTNGCLTIEQNGIELISLGTNLR